MTEPGSVDLVTGPQLARIQADEARLFIQAYRRQPVALVRGSGVVVVDSDGNELIDLVAGIAVDVLGHCPAPVRAALEQQSSTLLHVSNLYYSLPQLEAAERLVATAFPSRVFFCNSGAEANEAAFKIARKWGRQHRGGAWRVLCARGAFHGRTLATLAATGNERYLAPFAPTVEGFDHVDIEDLDAVAAAVTDRTAAILVEPVQGESGVNPVPDDVLRGLRALCDRSDLLLVLDEVQSGMGRTGRWWAHQHAGIVPDVMTVAKGLGGGVPIGAVLAAPRADVIEPGDHGSTFGGNPLATAVAAAVLRTIEEGGLVAHAARMGERFRERLLALRDRGLPVADVRGRGLMLALVLAEDLAPATMRAGFRTGVVVNAIGDRVIRIVPPLVISEDEVDEAVRRLADALSAAAAEARA